MQTKYFSKESHKKISLVIICQAAGASRLWALGTFHEAQEAEVGSKFNNFY